MSAGGAALLRAALAATLAAGCAGAPASFGGGPARARGPVREFVTRRGTCLLRGGERVRFVGSSAFALQTDAARAEAGDAGGEARVRATFAAAERAGLTLLRVAGFHAGEGDPEAIEVAPGVLAEPGLRGLDRVVAEAGRRGIGLVVVLQNYWDDYGGVAQQLRWRGDARAVAGSGRGRYFLDPAMLDGARAYAAALPSRRNALTGVRYADDPAVVAWEVMNEPRGEGLADEGEAVARYAGAVARALREAAPRQLVLVGDEGFDAHADAGESAYWSRVAPRGPLDVAPHTSFRRMLADPAVDAGTVHFYPEDWGVRPGEEREAGVRWIRERAREAMEVGKPLFVEEFGLRDGSGARVARALPEGARRAAYDAWFAAARAEPAVAAVMPWGLEPAPGASRDGFGWGARDVTLDPYAALVRTWAAAFAAERSPDGCEARR